MRSSFSTTIGIGGATAARARCAFGCALLLCLPLLAGAAEPPCRSAHRADAGAADAANAAHWPHADGAARGAAASRADACIDAGAGANAASGAAGDNNGPADAAPAAPTLAALAARTPAVRDAAEREAAAQDGTATITFAEFMDGVRRRNIEIAAAATTVRTAEAQRRIASARPDWNASVSLPTYDLSRLGAPSAMSLGVDAPIELGGKRRARLRVADADLSLADAQRADADRQILAAAATAFVDALGARLALDAREQTLAHLTRLVEANAERLRAGDIGEMELVQSRVERDQFRAEVLQAEADVRTAALAMSRFLGDEGPDSATASLPAQSGAASSGAASSGAAPSGQALSDQARSRQTALASSPVVPMPSGSLDAPSRTFDVERLVSQALASRADAVAAARTLQAADARIALARATLAPDLAAGIVYQRTGLGTGDFAQPRDQMLGATLGITLPFSRRRAGGELEAARVARSAADLTARATRLAIATEVRQAHARYAAAAARLELYRGGIRQEAQRLLDARLYAYARGGATLLELIEAQRRAADISLAAADALAEHGRALIALEAAAGIWDITF